MSTGLLASGGVIPSWLFMFVFLLWNLDIWSIMSGVSLDFVFVGLVFVIWLLMPTLLPRLERCYGARIKFFCGPNCDTREWGWARREGWKGRQKRAKGVLGLYQELTFTAVGYGGKEGSYRQAGKWIRAIHYWKKLLMNSRSKLGLLLPKTMCINLQSRLYFWRKMSLIYSVNKKGHRVVHSHFKMKNISIFCWRLKLKLTIKDKFKCVWRGWMPHEIKHCGSSSLLVTSSIGTIMLTKIITLSYS